MRSKTVFVSTVLVALMALGCGGGDKKSDSTYDIAAAFAKVTAARADLTTSREEVAKLKQELADLDAKGRLSTEEQATKQQLEQDMKAAQARFDEAFTADQAALSEFLTKTLNDEQLRQAEETKKALQLYAEEAVRNAQDFIDQSGDYRRAIELLENAEQYFEFAGLPVPDAMTQALENAKSMRYLNKERFDQVKKGMTPEDVKLITGTPYYMNIRESESGGRKVTSWLFNRADGGVAAIHFVKGKVYATKWDVKQG